MTANSLLLTLTTIRDLFVAVLMAGSIIMLAILFFRQTTVDGYYRVATFVALMVFIACALRYIY